METIEVPYERTVEEAKIFLKKLIFLLRARTELVFFK